MGLAVVTGATRGIGRAIATQLSLSGFDIAFCYGASDEKAVELHGEITGRGRNCYYERCDVSCYEAVTSFAEASESRFGSPEVLVNCAGITIDRGLLQMTPADFERVVAINLSGTFHTCKSFAFGMAKARRGSIINISSVSGLFGNRGQANYAASKAGIIGMSLSMAKEFGRLGVRVNVVAPGLIETDMTSDLSDSIRAEMIKRIPMNNFGVSEDVAHLVDFLASDRARYITGQVMRVDGGLVI